MIGLHHDEVDVGCEEKGNQEGLFVFFGLKKLGWMVDAISGGIGDFENRFWWRSYVVVFREG